MTKLELFNISLLSIGAESLGRETDQNRNGELCRAFYPMAAKSLLEGFDWSFALTRVAPTAIQEDDARYNLDLYPDYGYQFVLPDDCVRVVSLNGSKETSRKVERGYLYCNVEELTLEYIADVSEPATPQDDIPMSPLALEALTRYMSFRLAPTVAPKLNTTALEAEYHRVLTSAKGKDAMEHTEDDEYGDFI